MSQFVLVMALCGGAAAFRLTWIFVSLVGLIAVPVFCAVLVLWAGEPLVGALLQVGAGFVALQASYVLVGIGLERVGGRRAGAVRVRKPNDGRKA